MITTSRRGRELLGDPVLNKGSAFTGTERTALGLEGLLPHRVETLDTQVARVREAFDMAAGPLGKHIMLRALQDTNEVLFHRFVVDELTEVLPIIYTPTVGEACERFSHIHRRPHGLFLAHPERDRLDVHLANHGGEVDVVVVTDGERILGLGDQGVGGMGIPIGKLSLYTACAGIDPARTLPILLDVGTDNTSLLDDPLYMGWRHERIRGDAYDAFVDEVVAAVRRRFPGVLWQWEDFARDHASPLLRRHRETICSFNDDIQGTAAVALAAILAGARSRGESITDQRIVVVGAGSAGTGIAGQVSRALSEEGLDPGRLHEHLALVDRNGVLHDAMSDLLDIQRPFAVPRATVAEICDPAGRSRLVDVVRHLRPTVLVGVSGVPGLFDEAVVRAMAEVPGRPVVLPLSNPTSRAEAVPADVIAWTDGRALVATGSPFTPVSHGGTTHEISQSNNVYVFPGLGLGVLAVGARRVDDALFTEAARVVADAGPPADRPGAPLLPPLDDVRSLSRRLAVAVGVRAVTLGDAPVPPGVDGHDTTALTAAVTALVDARIWEPRYPTIVPAPA